MNPSKTAVYQLLEAYRIAVYAKDVDAFAALYADDVRVFDLWGMWVYEGREAWRGTAAEWFASLGDERVAVTWDDVRITAAADIATMSAFVTYQGLSATGEALRAMQNRITQVLERRGDAWQIVHEHSSAPADFETARVMLKR